MDTFGRLTGSCGIGIRSGESRDREDETVCRWLGLGLSVRSDLVFFVWISPVLYFILFTIIRDLRPSSFCLRTWSWTKLLVPYLTLFVNLLNFPKF